MEAEGRDQVAGGVAEKTLLDHKTDPYEYILESVLLPGLFLRPTKQNKPPAWTDDSADAARFQNPIDAHGYHIESGAHQCKIKVVEPL